MAAGCGAVSSATRIGMKPILQNGIQGFVEEPDILVAEGALVANMKLIEGVVATFPDDRELIEMAAMARANYAFGFLQDDLEALRLGRPDDRAGIEALRARVLLSFAAGRRYAERALAESGAWADALNQRPLEQLGPEDFSAALAALDRDDAPALFWLAFNWGGALQMTLDPAEATQLPKLEQMAKRLLELDDGVFYGLGPHMLAGVLHGFRAPALGGNPQEATRHFREARNRSGVLLPAVLEAQLVHAQTEQEEAFEATLREVIDADIRGDRALLEILAKKKACRLLANADELFLTDAKPVPEACLRIPHKYPLRARPLEADAVSLGGGGR